MEARHNYLRKITELAVETYIKHDQVNVVGLVLAGSADFKAELQASPMLDPRLRSVVVCVLDVAYGGENGLNQAIKLAAPHLGNARIVEEQSLLDRLFDEIARDTGKVAYGVKSTLDALRAGAVEKLLVWEKLNLIRHRTSDDDGERIERARPGVPVPVVLDPRVAEEAPVMRLMDWLAMYAARTGTDLQLINNSSSLGSQFVRGFGGLAALLRYPMPELEYGDNDEDSAEEDEDGDDANQASDTE